jgi:hypothetical protein
MEKARRLPTSWRQRAKVAAGWELHTGRAWSRRRSRQRLLASRPRRWPPVSASRREAPGCSPSRGPMGGGAARLGIVGGTPRCTSWCCCGTWVSIPRATSLNDLIERLRQGDETAWHEMVDRYRAQLIRAIEGRLSARLRQRLCAEDVIQSVFRTLSRRLREGQLNGLSSTRR